MGVGDVVATLSSKTMCRAQICNGSHKLSVIVNQNLATKGDRAGSVHFRLLLRLDRGFRTYQMECSVPMLGGSRC